MCASTFYGSRAECHAFAAIPLPDGISSQGVVIFAPENCPSEAAQRARQLAGHLSAQRIPYRETGSANFSSLSSQDEANRVMSVMNGPVQWSTSTVAPRPIPRRKKWWTNIGVADPDKGSIRIRDWSAYSST